MPSVCCVKETHAPPLSALPASGIGSVSTLVGYGLGTKLKIARGGVGPAEAISCQIDVTDSERTTISMLQGASRRLGGGWSDWAAAGSSASCKSDLQAGGRRQNWVSEACFLAQKPIVSLSSRCVSILSPGCFNKFPPSSPLTASVVLKMAASLHPQNGCERYC